MKKELVAKVLETCDGKFEMQGFTTAGTAAKLAITEKLKADSEGKSAAEKSALKIAAQAKVDALKKDPAMFVKTDIATWPIFTLGERYDTIAMLAGYRQAGYSFDLANITEEAIKATLDGFVIPRKMTPEQKANLAAKKQEAKIVNDALQQVENCVVGWIVSGMFAKKAKGKTMEELLKVLYLHKGCGGQTALPDNWEDKVKPLLEKLQPKDFEEIELD